jgi:Zinc carboxypeptidase
LDRGRSSARFGEVTTDELADVLARVPDYRRFETWATLRQRMAALAREFPGIARWETVGQSTEGRPIDLLTVGHGRRRVLCVGVPHPNEPIGTLTIDFLTRALCEDDALRARLDVTLHAIPVADPDGFVLNEGWFDGDFTPLHYARHFYRPPHREQVEWSFPVDYRTLRFSTPTPETQTVMRVMERVRPNVHYSLHNAGFCGVYFYVSHDRPALHSPLHALVESQGLPLHRGEPEVPYLRTLAPAVYALFGIADTYDYYATQLGEDPAALIEAGTSSDDWLRRLDRDAFSIVCELPYYTTPALADGRPSGRSRREVTLEGLDAADALCREITTAFASLESPPDHRLTRSVAAYVAKTPKRLAAERAHAASPEFDREATVAEACDATLCTPFHHLLYLGEVSRTAALAGARATAERVDRRLEARAADLVRTSALRVLDIRPLVAVQAGAGLLAVASG